MSKDATSTIENSNEKARRLLFKMIVIGPIT